MVQSSSLTEVAEDDLAVGTAAAGVTAEARAGAAIDADDTLVHVDPPGRRRVYHGVAVGALLVYAAYLVYRACYTINPQAVVFSLAFYFAELHGFFSLFFYFHHLWNPRRRTVPEPAPGLTVDVFITTYNEDVDLLRQTVRGAVAMRYPHRTYVLDDGRRPEVKALATELGCGYITRADRKHAKAGNWNNAFAQTRGELIATFDADHVPRANLLEQTLGFFRDPRVALVQAPQQYHNIDSIQHRANWTTRRLYGEQDVFFNLVMPGKDHWNSAFFCGTGAVLRRSALASRGGLEMGTITEDLHTSMVLHTEGWKSVYQNELLVTGLAPMDLRSFEAQRLRWAEGNLRTLAYVNPLTARGLRLGQRISYFASLYHWTIGVPKLIFYLSPPIMLLTGQYPIASFDRTFLTIYAAFLATLIVSYSLLSRGTGRLVMDELFNMANFFTLIRAMKRAALGRGRPGVFVVTSKRGSESGSLSRVLPQCALLAFSLVALVWAWLGYGFGATEDPLGVGIGSFWALYNVALMAGVINLALTPPQKRQAYRFRASFPVEIELEPADPRTGDAGLEPRKASETKPDVDDGPTQIALGVTTNVSDGGCLLRSPVALRESARLPLRVHLGPEVLACTGEVVSSPGADADGWYTHGIKFLDLPKAGVDTLNDAVFNIAVPEMYVHLSEPSLARRLVRLAGRLAQLRFFARRARRVVPLPVRLETGHRSLVAVTRDVSVSGASFTSPVALSSGEVVDMAMATPEGRWTGRATVVRAVRRRGASERFATWLVGVRFVEPIGGPLGDRFRNGSVTA